MNIKEAYDKGFQDGLRAFAWWKDGVEYVGTCGSILKDVSISIEILYCYNPPNDHVNEKSHYGQ